MSEAVVSPIREPDAELMRQHLLHLFGGDLDGCHDGLIEIAWTRPTPDEKGRHPLDYAALFGVDQVDAAVAEAVKRNRVQGQSVYVGAALRLPDTPPFGRSDDADFYAATCVWCDLDDEEAARAARLRYKDAPPTLVVVTGRVPGLRAQAWWRLETPERNPDKVRARNGALVHALGGDPVVVNPGRVMRLAGSIAWPNKPGRVMEVTELKEPSGARPQLYVDALFDAAYAPQEGRVAGKIERKVETTQTAPNGLGIAEERIADGRESYMRDTILAVFVEWCGTNGCEPTAQDLYEAAWPQYEKHVDFSRPGRGPDEFEEKVEYLLRRFHEGRLPGLKTLEDAVASYQAKPKRAAAPAHKPHVARPDMGETPLPVIWFRDVLPATDTADLVEDLLCERQMSVVYGESNCGKTFFMMDIALHVAMGRAWRGREVEQGAVIYVACEGGFGSRNRVSAFRQFHGLNGQDIPFALVPSTIDLRSEDADTERLIALIKQAEEHIGQPVKLVVIDTLSRAMAGGNENASDDMGRLVINADAIRQATSAHFCFIHHSGKDAAKGARGHSILRAATDTEIEVARDPDAKISVAKVTKQRDIAGDGEFPFGLEQVALGANRRGKAITSCVVTEVETTTHKRRVHLTPNEQRALQELHNVLADKAIPIRNHRHIPNCDACYATHWRERLKQVGVTQRHEDDKERMNWKRIVEGLDNKGVIRTCDEFVWVVK